MSLIFFDGFETLPQMKPGWDSATGPVSVTGRTGAGFGMNPNGGTRLLSFASALPQMTVGLGIYVPSSVWGGTNQAAVLLSILGDANGISHLTLTVDATGRLLLRRGISTGTIIATASTAFTPNSWNYLEAKATINDTTGVGVVKINGVTEINFSGDTKNAGTLASISGIGTGASSATFWDDLYVLDGVDATATQGKPFNDFMGERVIRYVQPDGNGTSSQWVGSDGNSVDNYALVAAKPWSTAAYVGSGTAAQQDLYTASDIAGVSGVDAFRLHVYSAKSDSGARSIKTLVRSGSTPTVATGPTSALTVTNSAYSGAILTKAGDGTAWDVTKVNALQIGVETA